jgi:hypothetical protein
MARRPRIHALTVVLLLVLSVPLPTNAHSGSSQTSDFGGYRPNYQGAAARTAGGRSGIINKVTNTNDTGPGSFRQAVAPRPGCVNTPATCARIVVFETSGRIQLDSADILIDSPYLTIAGQTAPPPGITLSHRSIRIQNTHDVVVQHLRLRPGNVYNHVSNNSQQDGIYITNGVITPTNVVIDHMSVSWCTATCIAAYGNAISVVDTIIAEGLNSGAVGGGGVGAEWGQAMVFLGVQYQAQATFARNLMAQDSHRQPWISPGWWLSSYNNLAFNSHNVDSVYSGFANFVANGYHTGGGGSQSADVFKIAWINNVALAGPQTPSTVPAIKFDLQAGTQVPAGYRVYMSGNTGPHQTLADQWGGGAVRFMTNEGAGGGGGTRSDVESTSLTTDMPWHAAYNYTILTNADVEAYVLANAGARPSERVNAATRDAADYRVTQGVLMRNGVRIVSQNDVGGYPTIARNTGAYAVPSNANAPGTCGTTTAGVARTVIECDLEARARALEPGSVGSGSVISAPQNLRIIG